MQGLPTPGMTDPKGEKPGWQKMAGDHKDRDLNFFDVAVATIKEQYPVDTSRIYATGHSNGGAFTYLLWAERGNVFAAFAASASPALRSLKSMKPKPAMHIAGEKNQLVPFAMQRRSMEAVKKLNGCDNKGEDWATNCKLYNTKTGTPFVEFVHPGTHAYPREAPALIVKFFKEQKKAG